MTASTLVEPAFSSGPRGLKTLGPEVAGVAELAGFGPDPEQRLALDLIFGMGAGNKVAALEAAVVAPRQNIKTGLFKQCALGWLFITDQRLIVWSAHEFSTAQEAHRDLSELITNCDPLRKRVKAITNGNGDEGIELLTGQRVRFRARTKTGGRGLSGDKVVLDEAFALQPNHMGSLFPLLSVRPDPQVVYGSSAGLAQSAVLRDIRDRGRSGADPGLIYLEWTDDLPGECADGDACTHRPGVGGCRMDDEARWHRANSQLARRMTLAYLRAERRALPPEEFGRERLGWWDDPAIALPVFGTGKWEACVTPGRPSGLGLGGIGLAVSIDLTHAAVVGAAVDVDARVHVKPLQYGPGSGWLVARAKELQDLHGVDVAIDGRGPGAVLIPALERAGVRLTVASTSDVMDACAGLFDLVHEGRARHGGYPELDTAVAGAVKRPVGDRWAWGRKASTRDISPLEAGTLAAWLVAPRPESGVPQVHTWPTDDELAEWEVAPI